MKYLISNIMDACENLTGEVYWVAAFDEETNLPASDRMIFRSKGHLKKQHHQAICDCIDWVEQREDGNKGFHVSLSFNHDPIRSRKFMKELREENNWAKS